MTTKDAAASIGMKPSDLTGFVKKHGFDVERVGRTYLWTEKILERVNWFASTIADGRCVNCGGLWDRHDPQGKMDDAPPAAPETGE